MKVPITFFSGLSLSRLDALEAQCKSWPGPQATAVYVPVFQRENNTLILTQEGNNALANAEDEVKATFDRYHTFCIGVLLMEHSLSSGYLAFALQPYLKCTVLRSVTS